MKYLFLLLTLLFCGWQSTTLWAQEPDRLPSIPRFPEEMANHLESNEYGLEESIATAIGKITTENEKEFAFCGQRINLDSRSRQTKLQTELQLISRSSPTLLQRAGYYFPIIEPILRQYNIPDDFKYLMVIESAMNPSARSGAGAAGLWQFMEGTAKDYGLVVNQRMDERFHLEKATGAACRYLSDAYKKFGDWVAVAQSYNIGQTRIGSELIQQRVDDALDLELVEETNRYIYRIFAAKIIFTSSDIAWINNHSTYYSKLRKPMTERY